MANIVAFDASDISPKTESSMCSVNNEDPLFRKTKRVRYVQCEFPPRKITSFGKAARVVNLFFAP